MCLILLRPFNAASLFGKIAESAPLEFTQRNRTTQLYFLIADTDYFPVALTRATFYIQSLSYTEWIWLKIDYSIRFHGIDVSGILSLYQHWGLIYFIECLCQSAAYRASFRGLIFTGVAANRTDVIIDFFSRVHVVKGLLVKACMDLFYLIGISE